MPKWLFHNLLVRDTDCHTIDVDEHGAIPAQSVLVQRESWALLNSLPLKIDQLIPALYLSCHSLIIRHDHRHLSVIDRRSRGLRDRGTAWVVTLFTWKARTVAWATEPAFCKAGPPRMT